MKKPHVGGCLFTLAIDSNQLMGKAMQSNREYG